MSEKSMTLKQSMISTLQISAMLNYRKNVLKEFAKKLKLMKVVAISR